MNCTKCNDTGVCKIAYPYPPGWAKFNCDCDAVAKPRALFNGELMTQAQYEERSKAAVLAIEFMVEQEIALKVKHVSEMNMFTPMCYDDYHEHGRIVQHRESWEEQVERVGKINFR